MVSPAYSDSFCELDFSTRPTPQALENPIEELILYWISVVIEKKKKVIKRVYGYWKPWPCFKAKECRPHCAKRSDSRPFEVILYCNRYWRSEPLCPFFYSFHERGKRNNHCYKMKASRGQPSCIADSRPKLKKGWATRKTYFLLFSPT